MNKWMNENTSIVLADASSKSAVEWMNEWINEWMNLPNHIS